MIPSHRTTNQDCLASRSKPPRKYPSVISGSRNSISNAMRIRVCLLCSFMLLAYRLEGQQRRGGPGETPLAINFADHTGFISIFDGKTLNGWDGATEVWHVEDGAIVGESRPEKPAGTTFLIWR